MKAQDKKFNVMAQALFISVREVDGNAMSVLKQSESFMQFEKAGLTAQMHQVRQLMEIKLGLYRTLASKAYSYYRDNIGSVTSANSEHFEFLRGIEFAMHSAVFGDYNHLSVVVDEINKIQKGGN